MGNIDGVPLSVLDMTNDEEPTLHTSPQNSSVTSHSMDSSPHSLGRQHENRAPHRQQLQGVGQKNMSRSSGQQTQSPQGQQKNQSRPGTHHSHSMNNAYPNQQGSPMHGLQPQGNHSSMGSRQNQAQYHHPYEQQRSHNGMVLHHVHVSPQIGVSSNPKFPHNPVESVHDEGKRHVNVNSASNNPNVALNAQNPLKSLSASHNAHQVHTPRIGNDPDSQFIQSSPGSVLHPIRDIQRKHSDSLVKLENEVVTLTQDIAYFRHVIDFQSLKIDKLTLLLIDILHNKEASSVLQLLHNIQASESFGVQEASETVASIELVLDLLTPHDNVHNLVHESMHDVDNSMVAIRSLSSNSIVDVPESVVLLGGGIEALIHHVAQAAVQAQANSNKRDGSGNSRHSYDQDGPLELSHDHISHQKTHVHAKLPPLRVPHESQSNPSLSAQNLEPTQARFNHSKAMETYAQPPMQRKHTMSEESLTELEGGGLRKASQRKKPKLSIDFLHNPMTVKEIYYEFTKGFQGQPPLRELDHRLGKYQWRGDSRTKESKRYQRRRKLCEAIERGMNKYAKSAEDIIQYIEDFRKNKSLTWVMNGNLPKDLLE